MSPENFCYWLQGMIELREGNDGLTIRQVQIIQDHLGLVFNKVTPDRTVPDVPTPAGPIICAVETKACDDLSEITTSTVGNEDHPDITYCLSEDDSECVRKEDLQKLVKSFSKKNFPHKNIMC